MRFELLEIVINKAEKLNNLIEIRENDINLEEIKSKWIIYEPEPKEIHILASDGSFYSKQYLGYFLGVFGGYAEEFNPDTLQQNESFVGDLYVSVIKQPENFKTLLTLFMFLSEVKAAYNLAKEKKPKLIMLDGTLTSKFIIPFPLPYWFTKEDCSSLSKIVDTLYSDIKKECLNYKSIYSLSDKVLEKVLKELPEDKRRFDFLEVIITQLAYYEHLITLYSLLTLEYKPLVIGLAKTSTGTDLLKHSIPDIKLFLEYCNDLGYSETVYQDLQNLKSEFGNLANIDQELNNKIYEIHINAFYTKYYDEKSINLVEYYQHDKTVDVEELIDYIAGTVADGNPYPFILKRMDREVRITKEDFELIERELEFIFNKTGRESLQWE